MQKLVLIDVAVCAALIMVAVCAMVLRWRRRRRRGLVRQTRRGTAAGPYGGRAARRETPLVPGFSAGSEAQDPAVAVPRTGPAGGIAGQPALAGPGQSGPRVGLAHPRAGAT